MGSQKGSFLSPGGAWGVTLGTPGATLGTQGVTFEPQGSQKWFPMMSPDVLGPFWSSRGAFGEPFGVILGPCWRLFLILFRVDFSDAFLVDLDVDFGAKIVPT